MLCAGDKHQPARNVVASIRHRYRARISKRRINSSRASWCIHRGRYLSKQTLKVYREKFKIKNEFEGKFIFFFFKKINSKFGYDSLSCIFFMTVNGEERVEIRILWISYQSIGTREKSWEYVILWRFLYAKLYKIERQNLNFNSIMFSISFQEFQKFYKRKIYKHWLF